MDQIAALEGPFSHASQLATTKRRQTVQIFACIFLTKIHLCLKNGVVLHLGFVHFKQHKKRKAGSRRSAMVRK